MALAPRTRPRTRRRFLGSAATTAIGLLAVACGGTMATPTAPPPPPTVVATVVALPPTPSAGTRPLATAPSVATPTARPVAAATPVSTAPFIVFVGDSLTNGLGATGGNTYPQQTLARLQPSLYDAKVVAGNGRSVAVSRDLAATRIDPSYDPVRSKNLVVLQTDLIKDDVGVEQTYADTVAFCTARQAVGWQVVVLTLVPRGGGRFGWAAFAADRAALNDTLRASWHGFADALADIAAVPQLSDAAAFTDPRYFNADLAHLTDAGYALMADSVAAAIRTL